MSPATIAVAPAMRRRGRPSASQCAPMAVPDEDADLPGRRDVTHRSEPDQDGRNQHKDQRRSGHGGLRFRRRPPPEIQPDDLRLVIRGLVGELGVHVDDVVGRQEVIE